MHTDGTSNDDQMSMFCATSILTCSTIDIPWKEAKRVIDRVHRHVCGHSTFSDMKLLLQRNDLWSEAIEKYLLKTIETCTNCKATSDPKPARKVSLSTLNRSFNDKICIDHMFLGDNAVIHIMGSTVRYSVGMIVPDTSMQHAICALESQWISQFWMPGGVIFDQAFDNSIFRSYLNKCDIEPIALPPRRHNKNVLESKHKILRDIYIRLKHCNDIGNFVTEDIIIQQTFRISNDLYGNDVMSSHELAK